MADIPTFPSLDSGSDEGSVDSPTGAESETSSTDGIEATTAVSIKPGGEDNDPIQPKRSVSPVPPKVSSHRKMAKSRLTNPLDAFSTSPETTPSPKAVVSIPLKQIRQNNTSGNKTSKDNAKPNNTSNPYGYEDAAPNRKGKSSPVPPMSMSSGAARNLRRGVPASEASGGGLGAPPLNGGGPTRRLPQRSNLKKSSSFNVGDKKQHLRSSLRHSSHGSSTPAAEEEAKQGKEEPTRGVMRRASMGSSYTTTIEVRVRGERFPVHRRRSINFDQRVEIKEVEPVPEMVSGNCEEIWLQEEDFVKMKQDRRNLVQKVKKKHQQQQQEQQQQQAQQASVPPRLSPEDASEIRGLEKYVDKSIRAAKNLAWDTVLLEQDEQELAGEYNDERIADLYKHFTRESPHKALVRAKQDEEEIQDYLWSPRTTKLMLRRLPTPAPAVAATGDDPSAPSGVEL